MTENQGYVIITGATGAIGREISAELARRGHNLVLACRNIDKAETLAAQLRGKGDIRVLRLDLESLASVKEAAGEMKVLPVCGLINNAGVMNRHFHLNQESGMEHTLTVNYLNTAEFTDRILPLFGERGGKVVFTTSLTRFFYRRDKAMPEVGEKNFSQLLTYGLSKRLLTDYARKLTGRVPQNIVINCADPGVVDTGMITMERWYDSLADRLFRPFIRTPKQGAIPALRAFEATTSGNIYCRRRIRRM